MTGRATLMGRFNAYKLAFLLAEETVASMIGPGANLNEVERRVTLALEDTEKAYHYAQRYAPLFIPATPGTSPTQAKKDKDRESMLLAFEVVSHFVEQGFEGLGYNGSTLKFVPYAQGELYMEDAFRKKWGVTQSFWWLENPWFILGATEKMSGAIRRVKAKTEQQVLSRLFMKEGDPIG